MRIYTVFDFRPFFRFLLVLEKVCPFLPHFYKSIFALSRMLHIDKNSVQKDIFYNRVEHLYKKCFWKTFVQYVTVWSVQRWTYENADEKNVVFHGEEKTCKREQQRILCKSTFS